MVASPEPQALVEMATIRTLVANGAMVVCAGGGGIPVVRSGDGMLRGVEAVVDKDLTAAMLAHDIDADALLLLTDVADVEPDFGTASARAIRPDDPDGTAGAALPGRVDGPQDRGRLPIRRGDRAPRHDR